MNLKLKRTPGIFLVGFMGSGKSTVGRLLAKHLGWTFVDLDDDIEAQAGMPIPQMFEQVGEAEFRRVEREALEARLKQVRMARALVVSLGGGAFASEKNREMIEGVGVTLWLDCPLERVKRRVAGSTHRPLARDPKAFEKLYEARRSSYALAEYHVTIDSDDAADAVKQILAIPELL